MAAAVAGLALLGLAVGALLNAVVHRLPRGEPLVRPGPRCPACGTPLRTRHAVPVVGWLVRRGRCADCAARTSPRYPLVELATAALFVLVAARLEALDRLGALPAFLWFTAAGVALALIDLDCRRLPNAIVLPSYPVLGVLLALDGDGQALQRAGLGAAVLFGFFLLVALAAPGAMQFGDVKLAGVVGGVLAYLSWTALVIGAAGAFLLGSVVGVAVIASGRGGRRTTLPFGPFMVSAALLALFLADALGAFLAIG